MTRESNTFEHIKPFIRMLEGSIDEARRERLRRENGGYQEQPSGFSSSSEDTETEVMKPIRATKAVPKNAISHESPGRTPPTTNANRFQQFS